MISSLFVITSTGEVIIEKHYRGMTNRICCDVFWSEVVRASRPEEVSPIITTPKHYLIHIQRNRLFYLATVATEGPPLLVIEFLNRVVEVFRDYFGEVTEESIKDNFITVYQLIDEMMDNGFPLTTEPNVLRTMITPSTMISRVAGTLGVGKEQVKNQLPEGVLSNIPWRKKDVKYTNNEIYMDIIEEIDCIIDANGLMVSCDVNGEIQTNCRLSGVPDMTLSFVNPQILDDCAFHPCVRYNRFERNRVMSFVPPDGKFKLASYRVNMDAGVSVVLPLYVKPQINFHGSAGRVSIMVGPKSSLGGRTIEDVAITIPFTKNVQASNLTANIGVIRMDESTKTCRWEIGKVPKDKSPSLNGSVSLVPGTETPECGPTILVDFKIVMFSASGLRIDSLNMVGEKYKPYKGVRFVTKAGKFQVRS